MTKRDGNETSRYRKAITTLPVIQSVIRVVGDGSRSERRRRTVPGEHPNQD
jgi:hypothetical protein